MVRINKILSLVLKKKKNVERKNKFLHVTRIKHEQCMSNWQMKNMQEQT